MRATLITALLCAHGAVAVALPQSDLPIDEFEEIDTAVDTAPVVAAAVVAPPPPVPNLAAVSASVAAQVTADPIVPTSTVGNTKVKRADSVCSPQPTSIATTSDQGLSVDDFVSHASFVSNALKAQTPSGYFNVYGPNQKGSYYGSGYIYDWYLPTYDVNACAAKCNDRSDCKAFNIYYERDPSLDANAPQCINPPALTNIRCVIWNAPFIVDNSADPKNGPLNTGQYRGQFLIAITGSNFYSKSPAAVSGFTQYSIPAAINVPRGTTYYMGVRTTSLTTTGSTGFDPSICASTCLAQEGYNVRHPPASGPGNCAFFNYYLLSSSDGGTAVVCALYTQQATGGTPSVDSLTSWAVNTGQSRGTIRYTVSQSLLFVNNAHTSYL